MAGKIINNRYRNYGGVEKKLPEFME